MFLSFNNLASIKLNIRFLSLAFAISAFTSFFLWPSYYAMAETQTNALSENSAPIENSSKTNPKRFITIGASAIVTHPSLDNIRDGIKAELAENGYIQGKNLNFIYKTAQNRQATAIQIERKFVGEKVDILVPIGTPTAQAAANATHDIPIVFSGVTDPVIAGLMKDPKHPTGNVTGFSDVPAIDKHVALIKELIPGIKNIGFLYNPSEPNSLVILKKLKEIAAKENLHIVESPAIQTAQVRNATLALVGKVEAIYVGTDNTVASALETAVRAAIENKIPLITADTESVKHGALAAYSTNYFEFGKHTGKMVLKVINGMKISDLPMEVADPTDLILNQKTAKAIGYHFPEQILKRATKIIE